MLKLPFDYVDKEVDKLYDKELDGALDEHLGFIVAFIQACGWTEDEFNDIKYSIPNKYRDQKVN